MADREPTEFDSTRTEVENYQWTGEEWKAQRVGENGILTEPFQPNMIDLLEMILVEVQKINLHLNIITNEDIKQEDTK